MPKLPSGTVFKSQAFEIKSVNEDQGLITGYLSTFGNVDSGDDRVIKGAFKKTLGDALERKSEGRKFLWPMLWMHDPEQPIGFFIDAKEDNHGLLVTAQLDITTNDQGIPNNPKAMTVFSGFKQGYVDEMSIGYKAIQWEFVSEKINGKSVQVRNLKEIALVEGSAVTALFAMNPDALVPAAGVKSVGDESKYVCGNTSGPIGPRDESWDGGKAQKQIWAAAMNADGSINSAVAKKYFMVCNDDPQKKGSYGYPFWYVGNSPHICVGAVIAIAGALGGARGANAPDGLRPKVAKLYKRITKQYPNDPPLTLSKMNFEGLENKDFEGKGFDEHYLTHTIEHWAHNWHHITKSLYQAIMDAFMIGDQPKSDTKDALDGFCKAVLDWVKQGMDMDVSSHIDDLAQGQLDYQQALQQMIRSIDMETKKGAAISSATRDTLSTIANNMQSLADQHAKMIDYHTKAAAKHQKMAAAHQDMQGIATKAVNDLTSLWQGEAQGPAFAGTDTDTGKSNTENEHETKASSRTPALEGTQPSPGDTEADIDLDDVELALLTWKTERLEQLASKGK